MATEPVPDDDFETALQEAAAKARELMPSVKEKIEDLRRQLVHAENQLRRLQQVEQMGSGESLPTRPRRRKFVDPDDPPEPETKTTQDDIESVLLAASDPMTVPEIRDAISQRFQRERATSTIYNYLGKGKTAGLYDNSDDGWEITEEGKNKAIFG